MFILPQNYADEAVLSDCVQKFFSKHHVGKLLKQCNGTKEKGVSSISLLKYKHLIFIYSVFNLYKLVLDFRKNSPARVRADPSPV